MVKSLCLLVLKFDLDQSEHKSSQVNTTVHKPWPFDQGLTYKMCTHFLPLPNESAFCLNIGLILY